ncbi:YjjW family glycine radical enzyme activase [Clostridium tagluense]|uniref:YjjW family glycine radical enzyme activase n=1 Tax=Clostridium tagluense TaxID=360422 RepID=UPI001C0BD498|nr:YjjW family glycine radical enzyme activase [Clostridium tagluense]MBU3130064.1 YjjW family glycine radical enzyme activase [Clostridium tagluense]MCB2313723.1 YjjW family glycine radical enzyme activase [Clostridium tagluense]MCB2318503.1 YjjW family glycine radical enzyme activase [Clostridium tagluense]MCB2323385.1 YjjW family glycine radical enzyme activase [Clostridium tagluense]MCB2328293.1 YjjW family glycine radical enzyme activase [Clostridium tagluense]
MIKGLVNRIIPFSSVDGPGNRTAIFLQGCNFNCSYCHNPETINVCNSCGECLSACKYTALEFKAPNVVWDKTVCSKCDECLKACKRNSSPKAQSMTVEEVVGEIEKNKLFISGITVSGGECTLQSEFLTNLFREVKKMGLTCFVDTNGSVPLWEHKELVDVMDMAMVDIKSYNNEEHKKLTGMGNATVIENVKYLAKLNKIFEIRTVIVPEVLDNFNNVDKISKLIATLNPDIRYKLIKYRQIGVRLAKINSYTPKDEIMKELGDIATHNGCKNIVVV